ncbi:hypothetical protein C343_02618 [Cryptococcus neoformans C23]|uniref:Retrograde transport protein Dsl1 C-terminal domain-containing protein n=1 Tax=Cryptococcus neoformans (strain H99 / ATCC 208821 / CBS 10515 / FGSC 9487) TaxID=235443 RepID=J9VPK5_CRYN9|nr:hypothetical protein CNAG_07825 [Cryptococcus neoformans var. grubii H99]AFR94534.1 hypothetical protein CNAG_07825 [Cryptococcus neoformans var. grubii H99]AUB24200.1 hypothetical protein CKF44_07825 [Cryptococcus neoformans var. grubii]OWZ32890.1 hypothetical protein C347_02686 [Cryptococcus neoformans var. grubii AD2-60a]OWZ45001.1 hypothetical protein C343_02618 [Cryptococcus neoformans var. grubii C23]|eukprot:XP_012048882.1 hypothetical protein CNAG_07825 [Cryptococcus neoformans var. grubii H99]
MFPVPSHLPRSGGEHISSQAEAEVNAQGNQPAVEAQSEQEQSKVLDLLEPLLRLPLNNDDKQNKEHKRNVTRWNVDEIRKVKKNLENAIEENKTKTHEILMNNLPSISSHIQISSNLCSDFAELKVKLKELESQVDVSDPATSFMPPLLSLLNRHFSSISSRDTSQGHIAALKALKARVERVRKLEEAVWAGQGLEGWVVDSVSSARKWTGAEANEVALDGLEGTIICKALEEKESVLRALLRDQLVDGFKRAVVVQKDGVKLDVRQEIRLSNPNASRPNYLQTTTASPYPLSSLYKALSSLSLLPNLLQALQIQLLTTIILPIVSSRRRIRVSSSSGISSLKSDQVSGGIEDQEVLTGLKEALDFTSRTLYPEEADTPEREPFVRAIAVKTLESLLDHLVIPSIPSSPSSIPGWLNLIISSVAIEDAVLPVSSVNDQLHHSRPLKTFWEKQTGKEYANKRRYDTADLVRMLVLKGWGRWEGVEKTREKEITVVVEVELNDDEDQPLKERSKEEDEAREDEGHGWGFGETSEDQIEQAGVKEVNQDNAEEAEDGWGFNEESIPPMSSADQAPQEEDEASGWDLDVTTHSSLPDSSFSLPQVDPSTEIEARIEHTPEPQPRPESQPEIQQEFKPEPEPEHVSASAPTSVPTKPPREAKRLGKKVAKKSKTEEYDPWDQPFDNDNSLSASTSSLSNSTQALSAEAPPNNDIAPIKKPAREAKKLGKKVGKRTNKEEERDFWDADIPAEDLGGGENSLYHTAGALGDKVENGGGGNGDGRRWDDDLTLTSPQTTAAAMPSSPQKRKRTELREEKKVIEEKYLVSTACEKLLDIGRGLLEELEELQSSSYASPSFTFDSTSPIILQSLTDIFSLYRALLPIRYAQQLQEVPAITMQAYNDGNYLAEQLASFALPTSSTLSLHDEITRLTALSEHIYEDFLKNQREGVDEERDIPKGLEGAADYSI